MLRRYAVFAIATYGCVFMTPGATLLIAITGRVCVDRDCDGNIQAMLKKLKKMNTKTKPKLDLVVAKSPGIQSDFEAPEL